MSVTVVRRGGTVVGDVGVLRSLLLLS